MNGRALTPLLAACLVGGCLSPNVGGPTAPRGAADAGVLELPNSRQVWIFPDDLAYTGAGSYRWPDGRVYSGTFADGRPAGVGREELPSGEIYDGHWRAGQRNGQGTVELADGGRYKGDWSMDSPHGYGEFNYSDGSYYAGEWNVGRREGEGTYTRPNDSRYEGTWRHDMPHGHGTMSEADGLTYTGQWYAGERTGYGHITNRTGITYEGTWRANKRHGYGRESRPDGSFYEGEWTNDKRDGEGREHAPGGFEHEGAWENNVPLGPGTRRYPTGIEIIGLWNSDAVASGILRLPSADEYAGNLYGRNNTVVSPGLLAWLIKTATAGNGHAQLLLGDAYSKYRTPEPDLGRAKQWYRRAAGAGIDEAKYRLGNILVEQRQIDEGLRYLTEAADAQHADASLLLGSYYQLGDHVSKNHVIAKRLYQTASDRGNIVARNNLAWLLSTSPDEEVRDGAMAVDLIRPIAYLYNNWGYYDTLAAALAEAGDYAAAREVQARAIALAQSAQTSPDEGTLNEMRHRLDLFDNESPFHEVGASMP